MVKIADAAIVATSGETHHPNIAFTGRSADRVCGTVFEIPDAELASADAYEAYAYPKHALAVVISRARFRR